MEITGIVQIISAVGFPIAMCLAMFWYLMKKDESHTAESKEFTTALNNNTLVLQKLCDKLDTSANDGK